MRYYKIIVLVLLFLTGVLIAAIESGPGQRWMQKKLREALADSGIHVEAEQFSGQLPQTMDLKNARIQCDGVSLRIKHLHLELSLFPLLHKEVSIENLTAEGVQLEQIPDRPGKREGKLPFALTVHSFQIKDFEWPSQPAVSLEGALTIERNGHGSVEVEVEGTHLSVKGTFDQFSGKAYGRYEDFSFATRFLKKQGEPLALLDTVVSRRGVRVEGEVWLDLPKRFAKADLHLQANVGKEPLTSSGSIQGYWNDTSFDGFVRATGQFLQESWTLNSPLSANRSKGIGLWKLQLQSPLFEGEGQLFWKEGNLSGHLDAELDLSLFSDYSVSGRLSSTLDFNEEISGSAILKNLRFDSLHVGEVSLQGSTDQSLDIQIQNGKWKQFNLDTAALKAVKKEENWAWAFSFTAPLTAGQMQGYWRPNQLLLEEGSGQYLGVPIRTETPAFITWSDQTILWNPFTLQVGEKGNLFFSLDKSVEKTEIQLNLQSFPLALFSSSAKGDLDFRAAFEEKKGTTSGQLQASISNAEVLVEGDEYRRATAQLEARLENTDLLLQSNLEVHDSSLVSLDLKLPVHLQIWPFQGKIYPDGPASAELLINGHVEEILDFFHWGMHRFAAHADCKMSMTGSLANPQLEGSCMLTNGHYENYFTGTELTNLTAEI
ncbi:MAG TPA: hypothetical protein VHL30_01980, partial [Chlamydiales bacterium]|nr:hypothetical protein [Chlamydiales bacterium]